MTVRFRPWACFLCLVLSLSIGAEATTDGVRYLDHWRSLGIPAGDIALIDKYNIDKDVVERLASDGVGIREYLKKPWQEMGLSESEWFGVLEMGSDISSLEDLYDREDTSSEHPNLIVAFLLPGYHQIKEERYLSGGALAVGAVSFAALTFLDRDSHTNGGIKFQWPVLWGLTSVFSASDVWYRYYREQSVSGFSFEWRPGKAIGLGWKHSL